MNKVDLKALCLALVIALLTVSICCPVVFAAGEDADRIDEIIAGMSLRDKLAQMMFFSPRTWKADYTPVETDENGEPTAEPIPAEKVTEINEFMWDYIAEHRFGGFLLFGENCNDAGQVLRLTSDMKAATLEGGGIMPLIAVDQEGGTVARLSFGTPGVGNMALAATGDPANAATMASVYGEELSSLGIDVDFAPVMDVNDNPANPVIGIRSFGDDAEVVSEYGVAYIEGLRNKDTVACAKHFPGHGNTDTDSHTGLPQVDRNLDDLRANELVPFKAAIDNGVDMVMTAHIQYPQVETETYTSTSSGEKVYLPATMSRTILTDILRGELGFEGVIVSDALDMQAITDNISPDDMLTLCINAGVNMLIIPPCQGDEDLYAWNDGLLNRAVALTESGVIDIGRVDDSVRRILLLKQKYGLLDMTSAEVTDEQVTAAVEGCGSAAHRQVAWDIAVKALTLLKNENDAFPMTVEAGEKTLILFSAASRAGAGDLSAQLLSDMGALPEGASIESMVIEPDTAEACVDAAKAADHVLLVNRAWAADCLDPSTENGFPVGVINQVIDDLHSAGKTAIVISASLPYDAVCFPDADAILLTYGSSVMRGVPNASGAGSAWAPNLPAAICAAFGVGEPAGVLPVKIPALYKGNPIVIDDILSSMTLDQKIAQMIMPAMRTWDGEKVTTLSDAPELAEALGSHPYGGVILFGQNIVDAEQTVRLISDMQANNAQVAGSVPYFIAADQEGGSVARLTMGTRGTGSMAIGATGDAAGENACAIGKVFGEELSALGINVNLGPCIDVISDLTDLGMSTRVFSDDPQTVAELGLAFADGVGQSDVVTCFKHFPGAGDGSDYPTSIPLTPEQLQQSGLLTYGAAIDAGAEMVMTSATTFPLIDDEVLMADGVTRGYYPATLSPRIVTQMLREELGFDGVVMTDALEMEQFVTEPDTQAALFAGDRSTVEHDVRVAEKVINAGCDILLIPTDLNGQDAARYYDDYIAGIADLVNEGVISIERIDGSVRRILTLKARRGILDMDVSGADVEQRIAAARQTVGSPEHHAVERETARQAITLLKNDGALPLSGSETNVIILGRTANDNTPISYAVEQLMEGGFINANARIENRINGEIRGDADVGTTIIIDRYYDTANGGQIVYSDELAASIQSADAVVCLSAVGAGIDKLQDDNLIMQGVSRALSEAHEAGVKFVLLSDNLPVDAARFQDADAIVCAYLSAGFGIDPTAGSGSSARTSGSENVGAFNANVPAALMAIFGAADMPGRLPIELPALGRQPDGSWAYGDSILYARGYSANPEDSAGIDYLALVNKLNPLPEGWEDALETVHITNSVGDDVEVEADAYAAYELLRADLLENDGIEIELDSARRSIAAQQDIMDRFIEKYGADYAAKTVAQPGYSEHHTGLALDLYFCLDGEDVYYNEDMVQYPEIWEKIHAKLTDYGFILRYLDGKEHITGYGYEPWHIRYVGSPEIAREIMSQPGMTLEVYLGAVNDTDPVIDYGDSALYTEEELVEATVQIKCKFASFNGCELHALRYAGDDCSSEENLKWLNELGDNEYVQVAEFLSDFHSPVEGGGPWEADTEYTDWQWWLARTEVGGWELLTWGY